MHAARFAVSLLLAAAAGPRALGQVGPETEKVLEKSADDEFKRIKELSKTAPDKDHDALMDKLFTLCKKTGDCTAYLREKEKAKKDKEDALAAEDAAGDTANDTPNEQSPGAAPRGAAGNVPRSPGTAPAPAAAPPAERVEASRREAGERTRRAAQRAAGAADSLRRDLNSDPDAEAGDGARPRSADSPERSPGLERPIPAEFSPANPRTIPEMALAARTGYAGTFRDLGLKVGAGPRGEPAIVRVDGTPASATELEGLGAALRSEPAALSRRPDFFEVLPREKFAELKQDYSGRPARSPAFRDIGMTERDRDFQWVSSCSRMSGDCNSYAGGSSYRRGQDVSPEDLGKVWSAVHEGDEDSDDFGEYSEEDRRLAAEEDAAAAKFAAAARRAPNLASLLARMGETARGWGEDFGLIAVAAPGYGPAAQRDQTGGVRFESRSGAPATASSRPPRAGPNAAPPVPETGRAAQRRGWLYGLSAAAGLLILGLRLKT